MVEVFKTNVNEVCDAKMLVDRIHEQYVDLRANFDLDDCDRILRVINENGPIHASELIALLSRLGFQAEILADELVFSTGEKKTVTQLSAY
ncbi:MAG TPA: hypothetical protein VEB86_00655 [Chryseosolibacter sp.]|nr:hypothetical protein [Chryseosolibacter sp.]